MKRLPTVTLDDLSRDELRALVDRLRDLHRIEVRPVDLLRIRSDTLWARASEALRQYGEATREVLSATSTIVGAKSLRALDRSSIAAGEASRRSSRHLTAYKRLAAEQQAIDQHIEELQSR
jgi:hypothetical protein